MRFAHPIPGSAEAELVSLRVAHHDPSGAVAGSPLRCPPHINKRCTEFDKASDLGFRLSGREVDVHAVLSDLGFRNPEEQDMAHSTFVRSLEPREVIAFFDDGISGHIRPEPRKRSRLRAIKGHVEDERRHP